MSLTCVRFTLIFCKPSNFKFRSSYIFVECSTKWKHRARARGRETNLSFPQPIIPTHSRRATPPQELQIPRPDIFSTWMGGGGAVPLQATSWMERSTVTSPQDTAGCTHHPEPPECAPGSCWGAEGSQRTHPSPTPVQPSHCLGRVTLEDVSECKAGAQEDLLQFNYLFKDSISNYSHILRY